MPPVVTDFLVRSLWPPPGGPSLPLPSLPPLPSPPFLLPRARCSHGQSTSTGPLLLGRLPACCAHRSCLNASPGPQPCLTDRSKTLGLKTTTTLYSYVPGAQGSAGLQVAALGLHVSGPRSQFPGAGLPRKLPHCPVWRGREPQVPRAGAARGSLVPRGSSTRPLRCGQASSRAGGSGL